MLEAATAHELPTSLTLTENRNLRFLVVFILYVAQGLPVGLFYYALPAWQAQNGASAAAVGGVLAMTSLPWSLKLINGIVMDRFAFLAMGRRRPWVIAGQMGIVIGLLVLAFVNPGALDAALLGAFAFSINLATTIQDVAVDGLAVDVIPANELGRANGFMFGGQAMGIAAGASLSGTLIAHQGLPVAMVALAALVAAILLIVMVVRERPGERLLPWSDGAASTTSLERQLGTFGAIFGNVFRAISERHTLVFLPALFLGGASYGLFVGLAPLFGSNRLGWTDDTYANWAGQANLAAGFAGVLLFGFVTERLGARRTFIGFHLMNALTASVMLALMPGFDGPLLLIAGIFAFTALDILRSVAGSAVAMRRCTPAVAATQFSVFMAVTNLGTSVASALLGSLDRLGGIPAMVMALIFAGLAGAAFASVAKAGR